MKKLLAVIMGLLLVASFAYGEGTMVISDGGDDMYPGSSTYDETRVITYDVDFDAVTADIPNFVLRDIPDVAGSSNTGTANRNNRTLAGWWLWKVEYLYGTTGATDNSDLYIWTTEDRIDLLGDEGANDVDNATDNTIYPATVTQALTGYEIFDIDNTSVSDADCTIKFYLYR